MKKIFSSLLLVSVFNLFIGCYSYTSVTVPEYSRIEKADKPGDIRVMTKEYKVFHFSEGDFYIKNDSLCGKSKLLLSGEEELVERKIALADIADIEVRNLDWLNTILLSVGIYLVIGLIVGVIIGVSGHRE